MFLAVAFFIHRLWYTLGCQYLSKLLVDRSNRSIQLMLLWRMQKWHPETDQTTAPEKEIAWVAFWFVREVHWLEPRLSHLFSHLHLLSSYPFSSTLLSSNLSLLSASSLLCFSSVHIVGSLTSKLPSPTSRTCMRRAPARPVRACFVRSCCSVVVHEHDLHATPVQCNAKQTLSSHFTLHSSHPTLHTSHLHLNSSYLSPSHLISCLPICQLSSSWLFSCHLSAAQPFSSHRN